VNNETYDHQRKSWKAMLAARTNLCNLPVAHDALTARLIELAGSLMLPDQAVMHFRAAYSCYPGRDLKSSAKRNFLRLDHAGLTVAVLPGRG